MKSFGIRITRLKPIDFAALLPVLSLLSEQFIEVLLLNDDLLLRPRISPTKETTYPGPTP